MTRPRRRRSTRFEACSLRPKGRPQPVWLRDVLLTKYLLVGIDALFRNLISNGVFRSAPLWPYGYGQGQSDENSLLSSAAVALALYALAPRIVGERRLCDTADSALFDLLNEIHVPAVVPKLGVAAWITTNHAVFIRRAGDALIRCVCRT